MTTARRTRWSIRITSTCLLRKRPELGSRGSSEIALLGRWMRGLARNRQLGDAVSRDRVLRRWCRFRILRLPRAQLPGTRVDMPEWGWVVCRYTLVLSRNVHPNGSRHLAFARRFDSWYDPLPCLALSAGLIALSVWTLYSIIWRAERRGLREFHIPR